MSTEPPSPDAPPIIAAPMMPEGHTEENKQSTWDSPILSPMRAPTGIASWKMIVGALLGLVVTVGIVISIGTFVLWSPIEVGSTDDVTTYAATEKAAPPSEDMALTDATPTLSPTPTATNPTNCSFVDGDWPMVGDKYIVRCDGGSLYTATQGAYQGGGVYAFSDHTPHTP